MLGLRICWHAVLMVVTNPKAVLHIFVIPTGIFAALVYGAFRLLVSDFSGQIPLGPFVITLILFFVVFLLMIVKWHQFILLDTSPRGLFLKGNLSLSAAYFFRGLLISLMMLIPALVIVYLIMPIVTPLLQSMLIDASNNPAVSGFGAGVLVTIWLSSLIVTTPLMVLFYCVSPILPATAIEKPLDLRDAVGAMSGSMGAIIVCALVTGMVNGAVDMLPYLLSLVVGNSVIAFVVPLLLQALLLVVNISILTTIYGYFVQKRELR
ncbi:MAG: hypothetical protein JXR13_15635 [Thalassovita sp.]